MTERLVWTRSGTITPCLCSDLYWCAIIATHTNATLPWLSHNASSLDRRQAVAAANTTAGVTERSDEHCGSSSRLQLQRPWSGLKVLFAKMLAAEVGAGRGDPVGAGALNLLLPFAELLGVLGEFKQCHTIFYGFAASVGHAVVGHPVFCSAKGLSMKTGVQSRAHIWRILSAPKCRMLSCEVCRENDDDWLMCVFWFHCRQWITTL